MSGQNLIVQPLGLTINSLASTYEELTLEFLGSSNYYFSDSPIGPRRFGSIVGNVVFIRQSGSLKLALDEMISDDPIVVNIDSQTGQGTLNIYRPISNDFNIFLREITFNQDPNTREFILNNQDSINFTYNNGIGLTNYQLPPFDLVYPLNFQGISHITSAKFYLTAKNSSAVLKTFFPTSTTLKYPMKSATVKIKNKIINISGYFPTSVQVKYFEIVGISGKILTEGTVNSNNGIDTFYPWNSIVGKFISYSIETDTSQNEVLVNIYFKPYCLFDPADYFDINELELLMFKDGSYRATFNQRLRGIILDLEHQGWNGYLIYDHQGNIHTFKLKEKSGIIPINAPVSHLMIALTPHNSLEVFIPPDKVHKTLNIKILVDNYDKHKEKGGDEKVDWLKEQLYQAEQEIVRLYKLVKH